MNNAQWELHWKRSSVLITAYFVLYALVLDQLWLYLHQSNVNTIQLEPVSRDGSQLLQLFSLTRKSELPVGYLFLEGLQRHSTRLHKQLFIKIRFKLTSRIAHIFTAKKIRLGSPSVGAGCDGWVLCAPMTLPNSNYRVFSDHNLARWCQGSRWAQ